jgi:hypothetical protein
MLKAMEPLTIRHYYCTNWGKPPGTLSDSLEEPHEIKTKWDLELQVPAGSLKPVAR